MKTDVSDVHTKLVAEGADITAERIKSGYLGKDEAIPTHTVLEAIRDYNQRMEALIGQDYTKGPLRRFEVLKRHVTGFIAHRYKKEDLDVRKIDRAFIANFDFYLRNEKKNANNTAVKYLKNFGKVVHLRGNRWIDSDPFADYRFKSKPVKRDYLTADELQLIASRTFATDRLKQVRDFSLFSCYTGLSYVDVKNLKPSNIVIGVDGGRWIDIHRQKSDIRVPVPLLPVAEAILDRYKDHPVCVEKGLCLPIASNQKMNEYLVEVAELSGVKKTLGNRITKRTFATTVTLSNGVPIESVSRMFGHTNLRTTQLYAHLLDEKIAHDMAPLKELFAGTGVAVDTMTDRNLQAIPQLVHSEVSDQEILTVIKVLREKIKDSSIKFVALSKLLNSIVSIYRKDSFIKPYKIPII